MNRIFKFLAVFCFVLFAAQAVRAENYRVLVLPDNIQFDSTNYYVYPDSSTMFASDTINEIKKDGRVSTVSMTEVRDALRKNTKLAILTKKALKEFKYNYNIAFVDLKAIATCFSTDKVLVITSQTDVQNYILRRTLWDFLDIPGATVIDPAYKLSTYAALIDVNKEQVLWQNTYYKTISSRENRIIAMGFSPATEQLEKIKSYSTYFLSPDISHMVQTTILPPPILGPDGKVLMNVSNVKKEDLPTEEIDLKQNVTIPEREKSKDYGEMVNDI